MHDIEICSLFKLKHIWAIKEFNMAAKEKSGTRAKLVPFFFKYKLNPELLACIGVSTHITNGLLKCPFQDNSILVFRPEWLLIWITVAWPHLKVSNIAAGSNTRSTRHRALSLFTAEPPGRALMLKPQQLLWLPLTLHTAAIKSLSIIKKRHPGTTHIRKFLGLDAHERIHLHLGHLGWRSYAGKHFKCSRTHRQRTESNFWPSTYRAICLTTGPPCRHWCERANKWRHTHSANCLPLISYPFAYSGTVCNEQWAQSLWFKTRICQASSDSSNQSLA